MAPTQSPSPYSPSIWSPLTSPDPLVESLINNQTNSWTFASNDFWQTPQNWQRPSSRLGHPTTHDFVPFNANNTTIANSQLSIDLERLLAGIDDLPARLESPASERSSFNRMPNNRLPANRPSFNHLPVNRFSTNQLPVNRFPVSQLPNGRLPTFRGLSGGSTDVSPSSSLGTRPPSPRTQDFKSFMNLAEREYDDYFQTFDQANVSDVICFDCLLFFCFLKVTAD